MVSIVFEQFLADPGLAKPDAIGNHDAIVAGKYLTRLFHGIFLKFAQVNCRTHTGSVIRLLQVVTEVLEDGLHVDLVGGIFFAPKLGGIDQVQQLVLEIAGSFPLSLVPLCEFVDSEDAGNIGRDQASFRVQLPQALAFIAF